MPLTEEQKIKLRKFILEERHFLYKDVSDFMPEVDYRTLRAGIQRMYWFINYTTCPLCRRSIIITDRNRQQVYCCQEHKKKYNNTHRAKTRKDICEHCGQEFTTYSFRKTRFCSSWCAAIHRSEIIKKKKEQEK